jgi:hypothetical protein
MWHYLPLIGLKLGGYCSFGFGALSRSLSRRSISLATSSGVLYSISDIPFRRSSTSLSACFLLRTSKVVPGCRITHSSAGYKFFDIAWTTFNKFTSTGSVVYYSNLVISFSM